MYKGLYVGIGVAALFVLVIILAYNNQRLAVENAEHQHENVRLKLENDQLTKQVNYLDARIKHKPSNKRPIPPRPPKLQVSREDFHSL